MIINRDSSQFKRAYSKHKQWCREMNQTPSLLNATTHRVQQRINRIIPEKVHQVVTRTIRELTRAVISGAGLSSPSGLPPGDWEATEAKVLERIRFYSSSAAAEGAITGFGGFFSGLADFPLWLTLKMKMLFEIAYLYGVNVQDYKERLYILHIFQLTFSSQKSRREVFRRMAHWDERIDELPQTWHEFDWRTFQLEYRDHIDLAKLVQLIPGFGAIAGAWVNHRYTRRLGENAIQAFRLRHVEFRQ